MSAKTAELFAATVQRLGIVATADTCLGEPRVDGTRATVEVLVRRFRQGESVAVIAPDHGLTVLQVESALRFHMLSQRRRREWQRAQLGEPPIELPRNPDRAYPGDHRYGPQLDVSGDDKEGLRRMVEQNADLLAEAERALHDAGLGDER